MTTDPLSFIVCHRYSIYKSKWYTYTMYVYIWLMHWAYICSSITKALSSFMVYLKQMGYIHIYLMHIYYMYMRMTRNTNVNSQWSRLYQALYCMFRTEYIHICMMYIEVYMIHILHMFILHDQGIIGFHNMFGNGVHIHTYDTYIYICLSINIYVKHQVPQLLKLLGMFEMGYMYIHIIFL